jgi:F-type H+-transporting ATPase subunit alpha
LDAATQRLLLRGEKLTEILKQGQYQPMSMESQVISVFAATNGYCDRVPTEKIREFEAGLQRFVETKYPRILEDIRTSGKIDAVKADLEKACSEFAQNFLA